MLNLFLIKKLMKFHKYFMQKIINKILKKKWVFLLTIIKHLGK